MVIATIAGVTSGLVLDSANQYSQTVLRAELSERTTAAMEFVLNEIRNTYIDTSGTSPAPKITNASNGSYLVYYDTSNTACSIYHDANELFYTPDGGTTLRRLLPDCTAFSLTYYDRAGSTVASPDNDPALYIRMVEVSITVSKGGVTHTLRSRALIRGTQAGSGAL